MPGDSGRRSLDEAGVRSISRAARLSPATVSAALNGRAISAVSVSLIAKALTATPPEAAIDRLLLADSPGAEIA